MKKIIVTGVLALCFVAASQQQASAWVNSRFNVGLSWDRQAGGNSILWGAWRNGQPPGPEAFGGSPFNAPRPPMIGPNFYHSNSTPPAPYFEPPVAGQANQQLPPYQFANYPRSPVPMQYYYYPDNGYGR